MEYPAHPSHYFTVSRIYFLNGAFVWGDVTDGYAASFRDACDLVLEAFDGDAVPLTAKTVRVLEIDGRAVIDRTEDAVGRFETCNSTSGYRAFYKGSDAAIEWGFAA